MISIINIDNICSVCEKPFKHKRRGFKLTNVGTSPNIFNQIPEGDKLLGDELKTIFFITCHERCNKQLKYDSLRNLINTFFLEKKIRVVDLE